MCPVGGECVGHLVLVVSVQIISNGVQHHLAEQADLDLDLLHSGQPRAGQSIPVSLSERRVILSPECPGSVG